MKANQLSFAVQVLPWQSEVLQMQKINSCETPCAKKMTVAQVSEELGYEVEIVKG